MLVENLHVRQEAAGGHRRWFDGERLELVVWYDQRGAINGFQLCFGLSSGDYALTWRSRCGFGFAAIDSGDESPFKNKTPVLVPAAHVPWTEVEALFEQECAGLEPALCELIAARLAARS